MNNENNFPRPIEAAPTDLASEVVPTTLRIEGPLTVQTAEELRTRLLEHFRLTGSLSLELGAVDLCDCAGIELLCSARKSADASGRSFQISGLSHAIQEACQNIGLDISAFGCPSH